MISRIVLALSIAIGVIVSLVFLALSGYFALSVHMADWAAALTVAGVLALTTLLAALVARYGLPLIGGEEEDDSHDAPLPVEVAREAIRAQPLTLLLVSALAGFTFGSKPSQSSTVASMLARVAAGLF